MPISVKSGPMLALISVRLIQKIGCCDPNASHIVMLWVRDCESIWAFQNKVRSSMHGVIIWYSKADFQAIIWCEDSKDLGIASGATAWRNPMTPVATGDEVWFRVDPSATDRRCRDIHLVDPCAAPSLPGAIATQRTAIPRANRNAPLHLCTGHD